MSVITLLQAMQVIDDTLRMRGSGKDRALFIVRHLKSVANIGSVVIAVFQRQFKVDIKERCARFGNKLFLGVSESTIALLFEAVVWIGCGRVHQRDQHIGASLQCTLVAGAGNRRRQQGLFQAAI